MKFRELKKSLALKAEPIYLVSGEDAFFVEHSFRLICNAYLKEPDINLTVFEGQDVKADPKPLLSALTSYPFLSEKRIVAVKEYYPSAANLKVIKGYFSDPLETTIFVILNSESSDALLKLDGVCFVDCAKGDYTLLSGWIQNEAKKAEVNFTQGAINKLIDACQSDMTKISGETAKLLSYAYDSKIVTEEDVAVLAVKDEEYKLYDVVDMIARRDKDGAYRALSDMLDGGDGQKLYVSLYNHFRRLLYAAIGGGTPAEMAKYLKVKEYAMKKAKEQSARFSTKRLKAIVDKLGEYDLSFKSGAVSQNAAMWNGILNVLIGG
ncbi:MAG: DNA polymerase III subunit delta [Clostridia bacterium]|nr:DNA polymerase III subunit delta [Clostridia bacterium]